MGMDEYVLQRERKDRFEKGYKKGFEIGFEKGLKQGIELGILKKTTEMVLSLFDDGYKVDKISNLAKISTDEVLDILRDHGRI
jgi:flagellar biosynthesis/type III secretory pathway protein FliH